MDKTTVLAVKRNVVVHADGRWQDLVDLSVMRPKPTAKPSLYMDAYQLSVGPDKRLVARLPNQDIYVFAASTSNFTELLQLRQAYRDYTAPVSTWENFKRHRFRVVPALTTTVYPV